MKYVSWSSRGQHIFVYGRVLCTDPSEFIHHQNAIVTACMPPEVSLTVFRTRLYCSCVIHTVFIVQFGELYYVTWNFVCRCLVNDTTMLELTKFRHAMMFIPFSIDIWSFNYLCQGSCTSQSFRLYNARIILFWLVNSQIENYINIE